ncbi:MAG: hypothetical protein ACREHC_02595 [Candidatus Levyibacteriota bacterium]
MLSLIIIFLFALAVAYFAIQNAFAVSVVLAGNVFHNVPLYFLIIASVLVGIVLASVIGSIDNLSAYMKLRGKDNQIHDNQKVIDDLQQQVRDLEVENARLKSGHPQTEVRDAHPHIAMTEPKEETHTRPTFMRGLLHPHAKA